MRASARAARACAGASLSLIHIWDDVDCVFVFSSWETHIEQTIEALDCGKRVAMEVGGSQSVEECWRLVRKSEETGIPVMMLENCCYGENELNLLNMIRKAVSYTHLDVYKRQAWRCTRCS